MHPLYDHAVCLVGRPIYVYHAAGHVYHGVLQSVAPTGIWVHLSGQNATPAGGAPTPVAAAHATLDQAAGNELTPVFFPAVFFAFGALAGFAAASLVYPFYW